MTPEDTKDDSVTRREFLKAGAAAGAFALLAGALPEAVWAQEGRLPELARLGELIRPYDVTVGADGTLYVANAGRYGVVQLAGDRSRYFGLGPGTAPGCLNFPMGVDAAADGSVFVADTNNGRIQQFGAGGEHMKSFGRLGYLDGEFLRPKSICCYDTGLLVADTRNHRVQYVDLRSTRLASDQPVTRAILGGLGDGPTDLKLPRYVAAAADGAIYVADSGHAVVKVFTLDGKVTAMLGRGEFVEPAGIAAAEGQIYVADAGAAKVFAFDANGTKLGIVKGLGDLEEPRGLACADGVILVADPKAGRVFMAEV